MPTSIEQNQRVVLVTGGARRVGQRIVEQFAAGGFRVAFTYLSSEQQANNLASKYHALPIRADLTDLPGAVEQIRKAFDGFSDRLDVLVNNASLYQPATLQQTTLEISRRLMAIHFEAPLLLVKSFEGILRASHGHIINMCDLLSERPWASYLPYCASKAALANLTLTLARELAPEVTVNGIAPGAVAWPEGYPQSERQKYLTRVPLARAGTPDDVATLVHFLATGAPYMTGQILRLDGGRSIT
jgi:pteridine reductase